MNLTKIVTTALCVALAFTVSTPVAAQSQEPEPTYTDFVLPLLPWRGVYYEAGRGGTGLTLDVDAKGTLFAVFYTYDAAGDQVYYMIQGNYVPNDEKTRHETGVIGHMDNPTIYRSANGECVGAECTYHEPDNAIADLNASFVWTTPQRVHITIGGQSWEMRGGHLAVPNTELIQGQWSYTITGDVSDVSDVTEVVTHQGLATTTNCDWEVASFEGQLVPATATICQLFVEGAAGPLLEDINTLSLMFLWYDPMSGVAGLFVGNESNGVWVQSPLSKLYVVGPHTLRGRFESWDSVKGEVILSRIYGNASPQL